VSRETRNLLIAASVALVALWILARIRFPDRLVTPNPIPSVLTQLSAPPGFADLASEVARVRSRLSGSLLALPGPVAGPESRRAALVVGPGVAVTRLALSEGTGPSSMTVLGYDRATGVAVVQVPAGTTTPLPVTWVPTLLDSPRFFVTAVASADGVTVRPVFVPTLNARASPAWPGSVWIVPAGTGLEPGSLLFTGDGEFVGLCLEEGDRLAVVPGERVIAHAERLLARGVVTPGDLGLETQELTEAVSAATGATGGAVVVHVAPDGPATTRVRPGDVIEGVDGTPVRTQREWAVRSLRVPAGETVSVDIRRGGVVLDGVQITAAEARRPARALGLSLRWIPDVGSEVVRVEPGSAAANAGVRQGDIITRAGDVALPTPERVRQMHGSSGESAPLLVAITRGEAFHVTAIAR
jgi:hypothetical protein